MSSRPCGQLPRRPGNQTLNADDAVRTAGGCWRTANAADRKCQEIDEQHVICLFNCWLDERTVARFINPCRFYYRTGRGVDTKENQAYRGLTNYKSYWAHYMGP